MPALAGHEQSLSGQVHRLMTFQMTDLRLGQFVGIGAEAGCRSARFSYVSLGKRQLSIMVCAGNLTLKGRSMRSQQTGVPPYKRRLF